MERGSNKVSLPVSGMSCAACVRRVEKALSGAEGVSAASVNLATGRATVEYDPASASPGGLVAVVEGAGYGVEARKATLGITGMTCAACAGRVEKALHGVPGATEAGVNLATEKATVEYLPGVADLGDLEGAIEGAGYGVVREGGGEPAGDAREREYGTLARDFLLAAALTVLILLGSLPMMLGFMPPVPVGWLNAGLLVLATPVQFWAGRRFYRGAWGALRHGAADMNTLVVV